MQANGNFVVYNRDTWEALYVTGTVGSGMLEMSWSAPYLSIFNYDKQLAWSTSGVVLKDLLRDPQWDPSSRYAIDD